jgi:hypothetical protein
VSEFLAHFIYFIYLLGFDNQSVLKLYFMFPKLKINLFLLYLFLNLSVRVK